MKERNFLIDNCKAISIFLVVFGHILENFAPYNKYILLIIYTFHMPIFVFFSGYLAKYDLKKMLKNILLPYLVIQVTSYFFYLKYEPNDFYLFHAYASLWYMMSLFSWYCLIKILDLVKNKIIFVTLSILFALLIGYDKSVGGVLSLSRTIVYFPIFAIGYYAKRNCKIENINKKIIHKIISVVLFIIMIIVVYKQQDNINIFYFYGSMSYFEGYNYITRFLVYICNFIGIYFFISWTPNKKLPISKIGRNSLPVYLLHYIIIKFLYYKKIISFYNHPTIICFLLALVIVFVLSRDIIAKIFKNDYKIIKRDSIIKKKEGSV